MNELEDADGAVVITTDVITTLDVRKVTLESILHLDLMVVILLLFFSDAFRLAYLLMLH